MLFLSFFLTLAFSLTLSRHFQYSSLEIFPLVKYNWAHWSYNIHSSMVFGFFFRSEALTGHWTSQFKRSKQYITLHTRLLSLFNVYRDSIWENSMHKHTHQRLSVGSLVGWIFSIQFYAMRLRLVRHFFLGAILIGMQTKFMFIWIVRSKYKSYQNCTHGWNEWMKWRERGRERAKTTEENKRIESHTLHLYHL